MLGTSAKERLRKKVTSRDPVPRIFQRLHQDAALVDEKRKAADRSIEHKQTVSRQHALSTVERWAALEREREERVAALRRRRASTRSSSSRSRASRRRRRPS